MLRINELTKFYGQTCAVNNVSLEVPAGCISILLGPVELENPLLSRALPGS